MNTKGIDLKPNPINSCTHVIRNYSWQQLDEHYIGIQKGLTCMQCLESHSSINIYVLLEQQHQYVITTPEWQDTSCKSPRYRVWICDEEVFFICLSFGYTSTNLKSWLQYVNPNPCNFTSINTLKFQRILFFEMFYVQCKAFG